MFQNQLSALGNFQGIQLESDITVITVNDSLTHTYCSKITWEGDNRLPIGVAKLIMPYSKNIESYWIKYSGIVVIHANLNSKPKSITQSMMENFPNTMSLNLKNFNKDIEVEKDIKTHKLHIKNDEYNYAFIGKVYRVKQVGATFMVYLEDLGWKFMQKVPKDFRDSYISGQSLDDAFQAICEFMGVDFAYSIEDLSGYNFSTDGYSIEKDGQIIEDVTTILSEWGQKKDEEEEEEKSEDEKMAEALEDGKPFESTALGEYKKKNQSIKKSSNSSTSSLNSSVTNSENTTTTNNESEEENTEETKNDKIEKYQEEFDNKIRDLFMGNTFYDSNISDPILNYNWITIEPKAVASTVGDTSGSSSTGDSSNSSSDDSSSSNGGVSSSFGNTSSRAREKNGWINGQYYINGKIYLSKEYINSLSPKQAGQKRNSANASRTYTNDTMQKLLWRSMGQKLK